MLGKHMNAIERTPFREQQKEEELERPRVFVGCKRNSWKGFCTKFFRCVQSVGVEMGEESLVEGMIGAEMEKKRG
jgi:hypothetical protein